MGYFKDYFNVYPRGSQICNNMPIGFYALKLGIILEHYLMGLCWEHVYLCLDILIKIVTYKCHYRVNHYGNSS